MPAGGLAVERCLKEIVFKRGHRVGCPLTNPLGFQSERGILNAGPTKRASVAYHGSSTKEPPAARGRGPLDPWLPWHDGFELWTLRRPGRGSSQRNERLSRSFRPLDLDGVDPTPLRNPSLPKADAEVDAVLHHSPARVSFRHRQMLEEEQRHDAINPGILGSHQSAHRQRQRVLLDPRTPRSERQQRNNKPSRRHEDTTRSDRPQSPVKATCLPNGDRSSSGDFCKRIRPGQATARVESAKCAVIPMSVAPAGN